MFSPAQQYLLSPGIVFQAPCFILGAQILIRQHHEGDRLANEHACEKHIQVFCLKKKVLVINLPEEIRLKKKKKTSEKKCLKIRVS